MNNDKKKQTDILNAIAEGHDTHKDFDGILAQYSGKIIAEQIKNMHVIEAGCSTGVITEQLLQYASTLDIVEGSKTYADIIRKKFGGGIHKIHVSLFEVFLPSNPVDAIVFAGSLHHIDKPVDVLKHMKTWLKTGGEIHITVPNIAAFHRQLGVLMGLHQSVEDTSLRNIRFHQPGRYTLDVLKHQVKSAGYNVVETYGFFFKPFPHEIMNFLMGNNQLKPLLLDGLFNIGRKYEDLACQLYLKAKKV